MMIFARIPEGDRYLITPENVEDIDTAALDTPARVLDTSGGILHETKPLYSIMAHSPYYEEIDSTSADLDELLENVEVRGEPKSVFGAIGPDA